MQDEIFEDDEIVTMVDEDGKEKEFYVLAEFDYKENMYIALAPVEPDENFDDNEVICYQIVLNEEGEEDLAVISDRVTYDEVFKEFLKLAD